jgi:hypothetical protein
MTAAEKKIKAYLDSIPEDEDRKGMIGYQFLGFLPRYSRRTANTRAKVKSNARRESKRLKKK